MLPATTQGDEKPRTRNPNNIFPGWEHHAIPILHTDRTATLLDRIDWERMWNRDGVFYSSAVAVGGVGCSISRGPFSFCLGAWGCGYCSRSGNGGGRFCIGVRIRHDGGLNGCVLLTMATQVVQLLTLRCAGAVCRSGSLSGPRSGYAICQDLQCQQHGIS
jgi:hypothetical protein